MQYIASFFLICSAVVINTPLHLFLLKYVFNLGIQQASTITMILFIVYILIGLIH